MSWQTPSSATMQAATGNAAVARWRWLLFIMALLLAGGFAGFTDHVWEDYFITARSSMNLAEGHGLVYREGERLHTFTSPLGTLLPALCIWATGYSSEAAAIGLFRLFSAIALGGAAMLMFTAARGSGLAAGAAALLVLLLLVDGKTLDFSINGMETGFVLLFLAWALWALIAVSRRHWLPLGLAWAGLMWTRPDGFIYVGAMMMAALLFQSRDTSGLGRVQWLGELGRAALLCAVVYLPWFAWAWSWYGTPVPHTIIAKANVAGVKSLWEGVQAFVTLPVRCWSGGTALDSLLAPFYTSLGGWPEWVKIFSRVISWVGIYLWIWPGLHSGARIASYTACAVVSYLDYFPNYPYPWYFPAPAWLALFACGVAAVQSYGWMCQRAPAFQQKLLTAGALLLLILFGSLSGWCMVQTARLARAQQTFTDGGTRRLIGLWLRDHAAEGDRVFLESLGYIGYYSNLTMLDFPGLASKEVVAATKEVGFLWERVIGRLNPEWLVLRAQEAAGILHRDPRLLQESYSLVRVFDVCDEVAALDIHGKDLLAFDSVFLVYHRTGAELKAGTDITKSSAGLSPSTDDRGIEVLQRYKRAILLTEDPIPGLLLIGDMYVQEAQPELALECYQEVLVRQPSNAQAHFGMGNTAVAQGRSDEAKLHFQNALKASPAYAEAYNNLGNIHFQKGQLEEAAACYQRALVEKPAYHEAAYNLANTNLELGRMNEARLGYETVIAAQPENVAALNNLAWVLATASQDDVRDGQRAVILAEKAQHLTGGNHAIVLRTWAAALAEEGRFEEAMSAAQKALDVAEAQRNGTMAAKIKQQLLQYRLEIPWRDTRGNTGTRP